MPRRYSRFLPCNRPGAHRLTTLMRRIRCFGRGVRPRIRNEETDDRHDRHGRFAERRDDSEAGPGHLGNGRAAGAARGRDCRVARRHRTRDDAGRYRRDVRRRRDRGTRRRRACGPARRRVPRQQGLSASCEPARRRRRVRREPQAPAHRSRRPVPAALARVGAARGNRRGFRRVAARGQDPPLGRQQFRYGRHGRTRRRGGRRCMRHQPDSLQHRATRPGIRPAAVAGRPPDTGDGVQPGRSRTAAETLAARRDRTVARRVGDARRPGMGARAAGGIRDSEGVADRTRARQPRRARFRVEQ